MAQQYHNWTTEEYATLHLLYTVWDTPAGKKDKQDRVVKIMFRLYPDLSRLWPQPDAKSFRTRWTGSVAGPRIWTTVKRSAKNGRHKYTEDEMRLLENLKAKIYEAAEKEGVDLGEEVHIDSPWCHRAEPGEARIGPRLSFGDSRKSEFDDVATDEHHDVDQDRPVPRDSLPPVAGSPGLMGLGPQFLADRPHMMFQGATGTNNGENYAYGSGTQSASAQSTAWTGAAQNAASGTSRDDPIDLSADNVAQGITTDSPIDLDWGEDDWMYVLRRAQGSE